MRTATATRNGCTVRICALIVSMGERASAEPVCERAARRKRALAGTIAVTISGDVRSRKQPWSSGHRGTAPHGIGEPATTDVVKPGHRFTEHGNADHAMPLDDGFLGHLPVGQHGRLLHAALAG